MGRVKDMLPDERDPVDDLLRAPEPTSPEDQFVQGLRDALREYDQAGGAPSTPAFARYVEGLRRALRVFDEEGDGT